MYSMETSRFVRMSARTSARMRGNFMLNSLISLSKKEEDRYRGGCLSCETNPQIMLRMPN